MTEEAAKKIDRAGSWVLATLILAFLGAGAYFYKDLARAVRDLNDSVTELRIEVTRITTERKFMVGAMERRLEKLEATVDHLKEQR